MVSPPSSSTPPIPQELQLLADLVEQKPESFATGDVEIHDAALKASNFMFNLAVASESRAERHLQDILIAVNEIPGPTTRSKSTNRRSKEPSPSPAPQPATFTQTPLQSLYLEGMTMDQIWEQLELRTKTVCDVLSQIVMAEDDEDIEMDPRLAAAMNGLEDDEDEDEDAEGDEDMGWEDENIVDGDGVEEESSSEDDSVLGEEVTGLRRGSDEEEDENDDEEEEEAEDGIRMFDLDRPTSSSGKLGRKRPAHPVLDDEFFSIDEFNRETEEMEALSRSRGQLNEDEDEGEEGVDLFGNVEDVENFEEEDEEGEANDPFYRDFFAPPPRPLKTGPKKKKPRASSVSATFESPKPTESPSKKAKPKGGKAVRFNESVRVKNIKSRRNKSNLDDDDDDDEDEDGFGMDLDDDDDDDDGMFQGNWMNGKWFGAPDEGDEGEENDDDMEDGEGSEEDDEGDPETDGVETIERLKDDLFAEDEDDDDHDHSTHEKRLAQLSEQISQLESENVGKKDWTLLGEAGARGRPMNSLLEEDLEYERVAKIAPIVTEESTKVLEDRIKARILENRFDDVVRKRAFEDKPFLPSKLFELSDKQSERSLAQIYEDQYTAAATGDSSILDDRDGKLAKEHQEIEKTWNEICYKLDALCNAHFTPKQPKATISTISNIASTSLESALPTTQTTATLLAPEEIHAPSSGGVPKAKSELTPSEKRSVRTKERKKRRKQRVGLESAVDKFVQRKKVPKNVKEAKGAALKSLVKSGKGVTVVGKDKVGVVRKGDKGKQKMKGTAKLPDGGSLKL